MGKGDKRSRKGKIWRHSYGVSRKRNKHKRPAFVPKAKKEKKIPLPKAEAVEPVAAELMAETTAAPKAKKAPAKKKASEGAAKAPAKKKATKK